MLYMLVTSFTNVFVVGCATCVQVGKGGSGDTCYIITAHLTVSPRQGVYVSAVLMNKRKDYTVYDTVDLTDIIHETDTGLQLALASYCNLSGNTRDIRSIST